MISGANAVQQQAKPYYASTMDIGFQDLERLKAKARIPVMSGTAGNVLSVLQQRIGHQPLDIKKIADCLQLSKRTLQRRLKEHMVSFVDLQMQTTGLMRRRRIGKIRPIAIPMLQGGFN